MLCHDCRRLGREGLEGLAISRSDHAQSDLGRKMGEVQRRELLQRQIDERYPGRSLGRHIQSRQGEQLPRAGSGDIPQAHALPVELRLFSVPRRSEEHTSELQSLMRIAYAVFCLKKK